MAIDVAYNKSSQQSQLLAKTAHGRVGFAAGFEEAKEPLQSGDAYKAVRAFQVDVPNQGAQAL